MNNKRSEFNEKVKLSYDVMLPDFGNLINKKENLIARPGDTVKFPKWPKINCSEEDEKIE